MKHRANAIMFVCYSLAVYALFIVTMLWAACFTGDFALPQTIDRGLTSPLAPALAIDLLLLAAFALQHSVMARQGFKRWWTRIVPEAIERSTYVLAATLVLALLLWQWRPIPNPVIWSVRSTAAIWLLNAAFWLGWVLQLVASFLIGHFELFGLRQAFARDGAHQPPAPKFRTPSLYRHVRHPIYLGFLLAFWATPHMTAGHLLFAACMTGYILIGIWFEERDLVARFGERYPAYREQVGMLLPRLWAKARPDTSVK